MNASAKKSSMLSVSCASRFRKIPGLVLISLAIAAIYACGKGSEPKSRLFHDEDDPTHSTLKHQWGDVSDREYKNYIAPLIGVTDEYMDPDSPLVERLQHWIDQVDENLRAQHPEQVDGVPKPKARVILNPSLNAFIAPIPVCHKIGVRIIGNDDSELTSQIFFDIGGGSFELWPAGQMECMPAGDDRDSLEEVATAIRDFNDRAPNGCKVTLEKEGSKPVIAPGKNCAMDADTGSLRGSNELVLLRTANWVNVYAGLVTNMTESEVIGVIAHELAHYYRSHVNAPGKLYDFFYKTARETSPSRPKADSSLATLGKNALAASATVGGLERFKRVPKQRYHSALFMTAGQLATDRCSEDQEEESGCSAECKELADFAGSTEFKRATTMFPVRSLDAEGLKVYAKFEKMASACLAGIRYTGTKKPTDEDGSAIMWSDFTSTMLSPRWPSWVEESPEVQYAIRRWLVSLSKHLPSSAPKNAEDASALVEVVSKYLWAKEDESVAALQDAFDKRVGYYTQEQEADEVATEWLGEIGIDPKAAAETFLRIGKWSESEGSKASASLLETPADHCEKLYQNGWSDDNGKFTFVAIGNFTDPHHHTCYRAFNVDREIRAHNYKTSSNGGRGLLTAGEWKKLQKIAADATADQADEDDSHHFSNGTLDRHMIREIKKANIPFNRLGHVHAPGADGIHHRGCTFSPF
ncbi:MAG: hypothetical protein RIQ81_1640 [Pseudomonadota bacterium]